MEQIFMKPLLYARNYDKPQEYKNEVDRLSSCPRGFIGLLVLVEDPGGWQARRLRLGAGEPCLDRNVIFLGFSPHSIALLQGFTLHLSLWKVKNQLFIPFCVELYCRDFMSWYPKSARTGENDMKNVLVRLLSHHFSCLSHWIVIPWWQELYVCSPLNPWHLVHKHVLDRIKWQAINNIKYVQHISWILILVQCHSLKITLPSFDR